MCRNFSTKIKAGYMKRETPSPARARSRPNLRGVLSPMRQGCRPRAVTQHRPHDDSTPTNVGAGKELHIHVLRLGEEGTLSRPWASSLGPYSLDMAVRTTWVAAIGAGLGRDENWLFPCARALSLSELAHRSAEGGREKGKRGEAPYTYPEKGPLFLRRLCKESCQTE